MKFFVASIAALALLTECPAATPFAHGTPVLPIGTPPTPAIPKAEFPYLMYGNNATSGASDVQNNYRLYPLNWTTVSNSAIVHSGSVFTGAGESRQLPSAIQVF